MGILVPPAEKEVTTQKLITSLLFLRSVPFRIASLWDLRLVVNLEGLLLACVILGSRNHRPSYIELLVVSRDKSQSPSLTLAPPLPSFPLQLIFRALVLSHRLFDGQTFSPTALEINLVANVSRCSPPSVAYRLRSHHLTASSSSLHSCRALDPLIRSTFYLSSAILRAEVSTTLRLALRFASFSFRLFVPLVPLFSVVRGCRFSFFLYLLVVLNNHAYLLAFNFPLSLCGRQPGCGFERCDDLNRLSATLSQFTSLIHHAASSCSNTLIFSVSKREEERSSARDAFGSSSGRDAPFSPIFLISSSSSLSKDSASSSQGTNKVMLGRKPRPSSSRDKLL